MSDESVVLIDVSDRVAVVTLNRPDARNALNPALTAALPEAIATCDARHDVDAIVLTGADPAFCAGVDLKSLSTDSEVRHVVASDSDALIRPFPETTKPVLGAINGAAVTGGFEVALTCDFLVASERARFADTHARVGIMPGWGLTVLLAEAIGHRRSRDSSRSTWRRTTLPACGTCSRPTARRNRPLTTRPGASNCGVRRTGWRR